MNYGLMGAIEGLGKGLTAFGTAEYADRKEQEKEARLDKRLAAQMALEDKRQAGREELLALRLGAGKLGHTSGKGSAAGIDPSDPKFNEMVSLQSGIPQGDVADYRAMLGGGDLDPARQAEIQKKIPQIVKAVQTALYGKDVKDVQSAGITQINKGGSLVDTQSREVIYTAPDSGSGSGRETKPDLDMKVFQTHPRELKFSGSKVTFGDKSMTKTDSVSQSAFIQFAKGETSTAQYAKWLAAGAPGATDSFKVRNGLNKTASPSEPQSGNVPQSGADKASLRSEYNDAVARANAIQDPAKRATTLKAIEARAKQLGII